MFSVKLISKLLRSIQVDLFHTVCMGQLRPLSGFLGTLHLQYPPPPNFLEVEGPVPSTSSTLHLRFLAGGAGRSNVWRWRVQYPPPPVPSTSKIFGGGGSRTLHLQYPLSPPFLGGRSREDSLPL